MASYYERKGNDKEKQEAWFYAGSVYRDLQDTPRALDYFLKSMDIAENNKECDKTMLRNTYSNLCYIFFRVQDYSNSYSYGLKEYQLSKQIGQPTLTCLMQIGATLTAFNRPKEAHTYFVLAFDTISKDKKLQQDVATIGNLLYNLSYLGDKFRATRCYELLNKAGMGDDTYNWLAIGVYYELVGKNDSAILSYRHILVNETDLLKEYDATKALHYLYSQQGNLREALKYANLYIHISDSIDFGKRQELAATVNNAYLYHRDQNEEQRIKDENARVHSWLALAVAVAVGLLLAGVIVFLYRRDKNLKTKLSISKELVRLNEEKKELADYIAAQEEDLTQSKDQLKRSEAALEVARKQKESISVQLAEASREIKEKESLWEEIMEQNRSLFNLLHKSELEGAAAEVMRAVKESADGKRQLTSADWQQICKAVDELYPTFKNCLLEKAGRLTEEKLKFCYLLRIGLLNPQIENLLPISRATVWRWSRKYSWVVEL